MERVCPFGEHGLSCWGLFGTYGLIDCVWADVQEGGSRGGDLFEIGKYPTHLTQQRP